MKRLEMDVKRTRAKRTVQDAAVSIADESLFQRMLSLERRRCERTGMPFALFLFDMQELEGVLDASVLLEVANVVAASFRETDIAGWYREGAAVGVILTTINDSDKHSLQSVITERTKQIVSSLLDAQQCEAVQVSFHFFPEDTNNGRAGSPNRTFYSTQHTKDSHKRTSATVKRMADIVLSGTALVVLAPVFLVISILIKLTSKGPVLFRQKRIGQFGEEFTFLKFRSMYANNDPAIHKEYIRNLIDNKVSGTYKIQNDPRVTPIGGFLRKTSLDELPQFINVLRGEMSLVGPRPPIPYEFESYSLWHRRRILEAKPGITGEWQVHGRSRTTFDEMVRMDLRYIRNQSFWLDIKILIKTPLAVLSGDGAY